MSTEEPTASPLKRAREVRGWSQARTMRRFEAAVRRHGETCPSGESLRRMFAYWESGRRSVTERHYQRAFVEIFETPAEALGIVALMSTPATMPDDGLRLFTIDNELVDLIEQQTETLRLTDRRVGTSVLLAQVLAHVDEIEQLLMRSVGGETGRLSAALAEAAALAGWLALDSADVRRAWDLHQIAKRAAHESGDRVVHAHVLAQQSCVLLDAGEASIAASMCAEAQSIAGARAPRQLRAWLAASTAEALAAQGESGPTRGALDEAERLNTRASDKQLSFLMLTDGHLARWIGHNLANLADPAAIEILKSAEESASDSVRASIGLKTDLALALHSAGRTDEAHTTASKAQQLAALHGSLRQQRRLAPLLAPVDGQKMK